MEKYKLIVFGDTWNVYQTAHRDWIEDPRITYLSTFRPQGLLGTLQRLQFNPRLNRIVRIPGKSWWNGYYLRHVKGEKLCFLITEHWLRMESAICLLPYLRRRYPQARIVCFTQDMVDTIRDHYTQRPIDLEYMRRYADLLISYDATDAERHDMLYHPTVFSPITLTGEATSPIYDLYFLGRDKGRLGSLIQLSLEAQRRGLHCHFLMLEVPKEKQIPCEGITYLDTPLPYAENLRRCAQSRCIVEMLQKDASSPTFRTWESIMLGKRLMTNNAAVLESEVYDERYISVFHDLQDFDWQAVEAGNTFPDGENPYREHIRPLSLIHFIEDHLQIQIDHS